MEKTKKKFSARRIRKNQRYHQGPLDGGARIESLGGPPYLRRLQLLLCANLFFSQVTKSDKTGGLGAFVNKGLSFPMSDFKSAHLSLCEQITFAES
jgi:hypothetical protein